ncbi:Arabinogalactan peptide 20 [Dendrobium catenatum]|uniref:Arabinogalactan peptide 20 n=1 Tax=Dendrobium catenatum TaxID=906689 RepID=A0A2I0WIK2_9ASPA|nr:Arabinogalactan peptide 20 [Dendrobium catenatum]
MGSLRASTMFIAAFFLSVLMEIAYGQKTTKTSSRWNDGKAVDQGIAYFLMLVALVVTFVFH